jgi:hypothetical protein
MTLVTLLGMMWSWRRQAQGINPAWGEPPRRSEFMVLAVLSLFGAGGTLVALWMPTSPADPICRLLLVFAVGVWSGTAAAAWLRLLHRAPLVPTEGIILGGMLAAFVGLAADWPNHNTGEERNAGPAARGPVVKR